MFAKTCLSKAKRIIQVGVVCMLVIMMLAIPKPAKACSCSFPRSEVEFVDRYDMVFVGRAVNNLSLYSVPLISDALDRLSSSLPTKIPGKAAIFRRRATIEVIDSWKGAETKYVRLSNGYSCGITFSLFEEVLVFTDENRICSYAMTPSYEVSEFNYLQALPTIPVTWIRPTNMIFIGSGTIILVLSWFAFKGKNRKPFSHWQQRGLFGSIVIAALMVLNGAIYGRGTK